MRAHAQTVIIGAGIVGCATAYYLAEYGEPDIVVLDRGSLFRAGGSTSHAPGGVFQNNASRTVSKLAQWTTTLYADLSADGDQIWFPVSSLEVATTPERWTDLHRKAGFARSWDLDAELLSPAETGQLLPLLDPATILGAIHVAGDGIIRAVPAAERLARRASARGVEFAGETMVTGIDIREGRVRGVETNRGRITCERLLICGGIWGPLLGKMAGVPIPLQPCAHPYVRTTPLAPLAGMTGVQQPIWRHQDHSMYLWQDDDYYVIGNYRHEPLIVDPEAIRTDVAAPADLPFDPAMMEPGQREAERLVPALRGAGVQHAVHGMFSFTPDAQSLIGEIPGVRGLWIGEAVWITHAGGAGKALAQLITRNDCELDLRDLDVNRFTAHQTARSFVRERGRQQYREVYDVIHPRQPIERPRGLRRSPFFDRQRELGAVFFESNGWERPQWHEANAELPLPKCGLTRDAWSGRFWSPIAAAEHRATREAAGLFDFSTFMKIEVSGSGALKALERISCSWIDRPIGRVGYVLMLNEHGGIESDVTLTRLAADRFLILAGSGSGPRDLAWIRRLTRDDPGVQVRDVTSAWCGLGLWGPKAETILGPIAGTPVDAASFPPFAARECIIGGVPVLALRISYVGEIGWELHTPTEYGGALWDMIWQEGQPHGLVAAGGQAMDSLRLECGRRVLGTDLRAEFSPHEAGLSFAVSRTRTGYTGHDALHEPPRVKLSCLALDDPAIVVMGNEPILNEDRVAGWVTSANAGYTAGKSLALGYLPLNLAEPGQRLDIEYFGRRHAATVIAEPVRAPF